jgi:hypothetical protein
MPVTKIQPLGVNSEATFTFANVNVTANLLSNNANLGNAATANFFIGNGSLLTGLSSGYSDTNVAAYLPTYTGNIAAGNANLGNLATANFFSGNGSSLTSLTGANVTGQVGNALVAGTVYTNAQPNITSVGTLSNLSVTGNITSGNANLGNAVTANYFIGNAAFLTGVDLLTAGNADIANSIANGNSNITTPVTNGNIAVSISGVSNTVVFTSTGTNVNGTLNVTGNAIVGNLTVTGTTTTVNSTVTRVVDPIFELGGGANGAALTTDDNKDRGLLLHYYSGASTIDSFMGWDDSNAEFGFGSNVSVSSEVVTFNTYGNIRGNFILGNGFYLTGIDQLTAAGADVANSIANGNSNITTPVANGNITVNIRGVGNTVVFANTGVNIAGYANITGNVTAGNSVTSNYFIGNGAFLTGVDLLTVGNADIANSIANGNSNITTPVTNGNITVSIRGVSNVVVFANTGVNIAGYATITGNITSGNANLGNLATANFFSGTLTTAAQPNITSVGTLSALGVTGNITSGNANLGNLVTANFLSGNGYLLTGISTTIVANGTSNISVPLINGNIIVGVGGTSNTVVFANTGVNIAGYANITGNVTSENANLGNAATANFFLGSGNNLSNIQAANVSGQVGNALLASTVYTNAQPNITSVGTLSSLAVTGNITGGNANLGNAVTANYFIGNGSYLSGISAATAISLINGNSNVVVTANANVTIGVSGNANIVTVTGTGANIAGYANITGNLTVGAKSNLGNVGNVIITGGTGGQYLQTDGTGNLAWSTVAGGGGGGGTYTAATTPPASGNSRGDMWYNTSSDVLYEYISDGTGNYWVDVQSPTIASTDPTAYVSRTYTANGSGTTYTVTQGANIHNVLVYLNGIAQLPTTDYTISGTILTFDSAPANGTLVFIRELMPPPATDITQTIGTINVITTANINTLNVTANTTTGNLQVSGNIVANGVSNLGAISNVRITGGSNGQFISTDGNGNLSFTSVTATRAAAVIMGIVFGG